MAFDTRRGLSTIISSFSYTQPYSSEGYLFPSEKNLWRAVLEAKKKGIILHVMLIVQNIFRVSL